MTIIINKLIYFISLNIFPSNSFPSFLKYFSKPFFTPKLFKFSTCILSVLTKFLFPNSVSSIINIFFSYFISDETLSTINSVNGKNNTSFSLYVFNFCKSISIIFECFTNNK